MSDHCSQYNIYSEIPNCEPEQNNDSNEIKCKRKVTVKLCYRIWREAILGTHKSREDVNYIHFLACGHKLSCYEQEAFCPVFSCKWRLYYFLSFLFLDWTKRKHWELEICTRTTNFGKWTLIWFQHCHKSSRYSANEYRDVLLSDGIITGEWIVKLFKRDRFYGDYSFQNNNWKVWKIKLFFPPYLIRSRQNTETTLSLKRPPCEDKQLINTPTKHLAYPTNQSVATLNVTSRSLLSMWWITNFNIKILLVLWIAAGCV